MLVDKEYCEFVQFQCLGGIRHAFLEGVVRDAAIYSEHAKRKTVTSLDIVYALRRQGRNLYGFGG
jgi:histone H3/H4